jgi:uncharacterized protein (TIGR00730 family)
VNASQQVFRRLCVFCGSSAGRHPDYRRAARDLGHTLAAQGVQLVYGGGNIGLMGAVADAVIAGGGHVIGVIPGALLAKEVGHRGLPDLRVVKTMHERKALMAELSDGFLALPGGYGTFEELFEIITWAQLGIHAKPVGLLNIAGFFDPLLALVDHAIGERFIRAEQRALFHAHAEIDPLLDAMRRHRPPEAHKWIDKETL